MGAVTVLSFGAKLGALIEEDTKMTYRIYAVRLFCLNWEETFTFYRDVLEWTPGFHDADMGWAEFPLEGTAIALERADPDDAEAASLVGRFVGVSLAVDDIDATFASLVERGVDFTGPPERQPWGGTLAHFRDPAGNILTLLGGTQ